VTTKLRVFLKRIDTSATQELTVPLRVEVLVYIYSEWICECKCWCRLH